MIGRERLRGLLGAPAGSNATERHNFNYAFRESALIGVINAGGVFLPVFLVRLGASNLEVSMLTALPALAGVLLAIPIGAFMQSRRNIVPWYSRGRIGSQAAFGAAALASFLLPDHLVVPGILVTWGVATVFSTMTNVAFNVVMDATAGTRGRFELMSRRWSIMGVTTATSLAVAGFALGRISFPLNFQIVFIVFSLMGIWAYRYGSRLIVPDHPLADQANRPPLLARIGGAIRLVRGEPAFIGFELRRVVYAMGTTLALPLVPLYYVRSLEASNSWIGLIGTAQALVLLLGYALWRYEARRRGSKFVLVAATLGAALHPGLLALTHDVAFAALLAGAAAIFTSGVNLAIFDRLMTTVPPGRGVTFNSIDNTIVNVAGMAAPVLGALLADRIGLSGALGVASVIGVAGALLFAFDRSGSPTSEPGAASGG